MRPVAVFPILFIGSLGASLALAAIVYTLRRDAHADRTARIILAWGFLVSGAVWLASGGILFGGSMTLAGIGFVFAAHRNSPLAVEDCAACHHGVMTIAEAQTLLDLGDQHDEQDIHAASERMLDDPALAGPARQKFEQARDLLLEILAEDT